MAQILSPIRDELVNLPLITNFGFPTREELGFAALSRPSEVLRLEKLLKRNVSRSRHKPKVKGSQVSHCSYTSATVDTCS